MTPVGSVKFYVGTFQEIKTIRFMNIYTTFSVVDAEFDRNDLVNRRFIASPHGLMQSR
jgi:hypothetical protein